jgi:hypothetical protein
MMSFLFLANIGRRDFGRISLAECSSEDVTFGGVLLCWWHLIWWAGLGIRLSFGGFVAAMVFPTASLFLSPCLSFPAGSDRVSTSIRNGANCRKVHNPHNSSRRSNTHDRFLGILLS